MVRFDPSFVLLIKVVIVIQYFGLSSQSIAVVLLKFDNKPFCKVPVFTISNDDRLNDYVAEQRLQTRILRNALHIMLSYYAYSILSHS